MEEAIESHLWLGSWGSAQDKALGRFSPSMAGSLLSKQQLQKGRVCSELISHCSPPHSPWHTAVFVIQGWTRRGRKGRGKRKGKGRKETEREVREGMGRRVREGPMRETCSRKKAVLGSQKQL